MPFGLPSAVSYNPMQINVVFQSYKAETPARGYWDQAMLEDLFSRSLWNPVNGYSFRFISMEDVVPADGAIVVFPARAQADCIDKLNADIDRLKWCILILTGDEESVFPFEKLHRRPELKVWVMAPRPDRHSSADRFIGSGYPTGARKLMADYEFEAMNRLNEWFFAGQNTHPRRKMCTEELSKSHGLVGKLLTTQAFTTGYPRPDYYKNLCSAKVFPCPAGPFTPDTFRFFETLESGGIPIADRIASVTGYPEGYFDLLFRDIPGHRPFPELEKYSDLIGYMEDVLRERPLETWTTRSNRAFAWWQRVKRSMAYWIVEDLKALGLPASEEDELRDNITVIIPTSPIPSHPDISMLVETIRTVRAHLPESEIIVTFDGVRTEQEDRRKSYEEYIRRALWHFNFKEKNVLPIVFSEHKHQSGMMREALKLVKTPEVLYVEHDAPLTPDRPIEWSNLIGAIRNGDANVIRFHFEEMIHPEHKHLMFDEEPQEVHYAPMMRTFQWSQRPHLASTEFYRRILSLYFPESSKTMIEDLLYGIVWEKCTTGGIMAWYEFRLWIYTPLPQIKRSYHLDGRSSDPKYDMKFK